MKRMLINATQPEELRVALVDGQYLYDIDIERPSRQQKKANVYKGKITRVEPSLGAAFVYYGSERHGFLPLKEIAPEYYTRPLNNPDERPNIHEVIREGQEVMVQVDKEERGNKGAALSTYISLAGCYLVLMPNNPRAGGISRRIEGEERSELRDVINNLEIPEGAGIIVRTAGVGKSFDELQWDLSILLKQAEAIQKAFEKSPAPFLIHRESDVIIRAIRDHLRQDINEILVDDPDIYQKARKYIQQVRPEFANRVKQYRDRTPLFNRFQIERQIESAFEREVQLPSGGAIVIDHTEALVSIDINSARATKGGDIEETALNTNLEASDEIARQLRLRDLGGLIVIDFIDMNISRNQREVENRLREALKMDRARVQIGRISRFGLLEMSRQRLRTSLGETSQATCPRCSGQGSIRGVESLSLSIVRILEEEALRNARRHANEKLGALRVQVPVEVASFLLNEKREDISRIETNYHLNVVIIPNPYMETPHYKLQRVKRDQMRHGRQTASHRLIEKTDGSLIEESTHTHMGNVEHPAVESMEIINQTRETQGLVKRLFSSLFGSEQQAPESANEASAQATSQREHKTPDQSPSRSRDSRQQRGRSRSSSGDNRRRRSPSESKGKGRSSDTTQTKQATPAQEGAQQSSESSSEGKSQQQRGRNSQRRSRQRSNRGRSNAHNNQERRNASKRDEKLAQDYQEYSDYNTAGEKPTEQATPSDTSLQNVQEYEQTQKQRQRQRSQRHPQKKGPHKPAPSVDTEVQHMPASDTIPGEGEEDIFDTPPPVVREKDSLVPRLESEENTLDFDNVNIDSEMRESSEQGHTAETNSTNAEGNEASTDATGENRQRNRNRRGQRNGRRRSGHLRSHSHAKRKNHREKTAESDEQQTNEQSKNEPGQTQQPDVTSDNKE